MPVRPCYDSVTHLSRTCCYHYRGCDHNRVTCDSARSCTGHQRVSPHLVRNSTGMIEPLLFQQLRGSGSAAWFHEQHSLDAMLGIFRHAVPVGACEGVLPFPDPPQDGMVCGPPKGGVPHKQDVHDHTSAPDVTAALVSSLAQNLCGVIYVFWFVIVCVRWLSFTLESLAVGECDVGSWCEGG